MNRLLFTTFLDILFIAFMTSCNNEDAPTNTTMSELRWVEGNYTGKYVQSTKIYHGTNPTPATDYYSVQHCTVKVTLNSDGTLSIIIRGDYNSTLQNQTFTVSENYNTIKCNRYTFDKDAQSIRYYERDDRGFNNGQSYQEAYKLFEAYKDF